MLYVQESLGPQEELIHVGQFHWTYTIGAFMSILWALLASILALAALIFMYHKLGKLPPDIGGVDAIPYLDPGLRIGVFALFLTGVADFARRMIVKATTEIAVTTSRLIYKRGVVARYVGEMNIDRIEGVNVLQTFLGRIFNYGRLAVRGMGIGEVVLPPIENPLAFRQAIERAKTT